MHCEAVGVGGRAEVLRIRLELMIRACDAIQREIANLTASTVRPRGSNGAACPTAGGPNPPQQQRPTPTQRGAGRLSTGW
jgi:hypothetical protein